MAATLPLPSAPPPAGPAAAGALDRLAASERYGYGRGWLTGTMPMVMQEDPFLCRFVTIFEEIAASVRYGVDRCDSIADLSVAPAPMVRYLGDWIGAQGATPELAPERQREIVRATGTTLAWRGTARGVQELLEAITGGPVSVSDGGAVRRADDTAVAAGSGPAPAASGAVAPVVVRLATAGHLRHDEVVAVVRDEVPAHLPIVVLVAGELVAGERVMGDSVTGDSVTTVVGEDRS